MRRRRLTRYVLLALAVLAGMALGYRYQQRREQAKATPKPVAIEDGKTIDFSSGKPVVKDDAADRAALEKAKREMDEAAANVTFAPTKPPPPPENSK